MAQHKVLRKFTGSELEIELKYYVIGLLLTRPWSNEPP